MKLTRANYHSPKNKALSCSKVGDFLKSRRYFWDKHIARTVVEEPTPSMTIGSMVDEALTVGSTRAIDKTWTVKVLKSADPDLYERQKENPEFVVTENQMETAKEMASTVLASDWYIEDAGRDPQIQVPITGKIGRTPACFMPDHFIVEGVDTPNAPITITITDWKTTAPGDVKTPTRWLWKCREYGYFRQFAMASLIFRQQYKDRKVNFIFRHAVIESQKNGRYRQHLFIFDDSLITDAYWELVATVTEIERCLAIGEAAFDDPTPSWDEAVYLMDEGIEA